MTVTDKIAEQRLSVLELAEKLGNTSKACRLRGMRRSQFYVYKRRFQDHGLEGLKDLPPIPKSHPMTTPAGVIVQILALSLAHPAWGCVRLSDHLKPQGVSVSSPTIQNILIKYGMANKHDRWLKLEEKHACESIELSDEQISFIEKQNPSFKERRVESSRPGALLCQDTLFVGRVKGMGKIYLHIVIDSFSSHAFGLLHASKQPEAAVAVLHNNVLPFFAERKITVSTILTDNGLEFCGMPTHPYEVYLERHDIEHQRVRVKFPRTNGFVERFNGSVLEEFFRETFRMSLYHTVGALQNDLDKWLVQYNTARQHQGYRNMGRCPIDTINQYLEFTR